MKKASTFFMGSLNPPPLRGGREAEIVNTP